MSLLRSGARSGMRFSFIDGGAVLLSYRLVQVTVRFYSYFRDLTRCSEMNQSLPERSTIAELLETLFTRFPDLAQMKNSALIAVGVEYQLRDYVLKEGDEVSLFPPVQGG